MVITAKDRYDLLFTMETEQIFFFEQTRKILVSNKGLQVVFNSGV